MKNRLKIILIIFSIIPGIVKMSMAEEFVPIPQQRPDKLTVSPAYIKQLMEQQKKQQEIETPSQVGSDIIYEDTDKEEDHYLFDTEPQKQSLDMEELIERDIMREINDENQEKQTALETTLNDIEPATSDLIEELIIPIPNVKPSTQEIQAATLGKETKNQDTLGNNETAIISFMLKHGQIKLDDALKLFLSDHALKIFKENKDVILDIQAYSAGEDGYEDSDIRISLARALEVRKYLIEKDIHPSRLKLSALGRDKNGKNSNRIDLVFAEEK